MYTYYLAGNSLAILDYNVPLDQTTSTRCLSYWYFMSGSVGTLSVGLKAGSTDGDYVIAWYRSGNHGSRWRQGQLQIPANYPRIFQVTLLTLLALCDGNPPVDSLHKGTVIWVHWCFRVADVTGPLCWESPVDSLHKGTVRWGVYVFIIPPPNEVYWIHLVFVGLMSSFWTYSGDMRRHGARMTHVNAVSIYCGFSGCSH